VPDWRLKYADLQTIIEHAWQWEQQLAGQHSL